MSRKTPEIIEIKAAEGEALRERLKSGQLSPEDCKLLDRVIVSLMYVMSLLEKKKTTIDRLRKLIFGPSSETQRNVFPSSNNQSNRDSNTIDCEPPHSDPSSDDKLATELPNSHIDRPVDPQEPISPAQIETAQQQGGPERSNGKSKNKKPGHGSLGADDYTGATIQSALLDGLSPGDPCPECGDGTLYEKPPGVIVRIVGEAPLQGTVYQLQKLRCHMCGKTFTASPPDEVGDSKYDATAAAMIGLLKYGLGVPFHRLQRMQNTLGVPLPASTQWGVIHAMFHHCVPVFEVLVDMAAQGDLLYHDDTGITILEYLTQHGTQPCQPEIDESTSSRTVNRTGMFTTGVVVKHEQRTIVLFFSDRQHAGEILRDLLKRRKENLPPPIQMCDPLSRNMPSDLKTILANCLAHARRKFVEIADRFEDECRYIIEKLAIIYHNDKIAIEEQMTPEERLKFHQQHSGPRMETLREWLKARLEQRLVEPNSALGEAITYFLKHWEAFTLFLRQAGAPLDNNICERALKRAILHRKNALFYKTQNGARVGDTLMSIIYTCEQNGINPFDYLTAIQLHTEEVVAHPELWLPWNYQATLTGQATLDAA